MFSRIFRSHLKCIYVEVFVFSLLLAGYSQLQIVDLYNAFAPLSAVPGFRRILQYASWTLCETATTEMVVPYTSSSQCVFQTDSLGMPTSSHIHDTGLVRLSSSRVAVATPEQSVIRGLPRIQINHKSGVITWEVANCSWHIARIEGLGLETT